MKQTSRNVSIAFVILSSLAFLAIFRWLRISAVPWDFTYLSIGRIFGPILGLVVLALVLIAILSLPAKIINDFLNLSTKITRKDLVLIIKKKKTVGKVSLGLALAFLITFSFSFVFATQVSQTGTRIKNFVVANADQSFEDYVGNVSSFLNANVNSAYNKPEGMFKIDDEITSTFLDPYVMKSYGISRADLILYQGWGTCGQAAILIEELLHDAGYVTREAYFKNIDHQWAEVHYNGTWLIIDPWYIDNFAEIQNLRNLKPEFQQASGVEVLYMNGTVVDASTQHGY